MSSKKKKPKAAESDTSPAPIEATEADERQEGAPSEAAPETVPEGEEAAEQAAPHERTVADREAAEALADAAVVEPVAKVPVAEVSTNPQSAVEAVGAVDTGAAVPAQAGTGAIGAAGDAAPVPVLEAHPVTRVVAPLEPAMDAVEAYLASPPDPDSKADAIARGLLNGIADGITGRPTLRGNGPTIDGVRSAADFGHFIGGCLRMGLGMTPELYALVGRAAPGAPPRA